MGYIQSAPTGPQPALLVGGYRIAMRPAASDLGPTVKLSLPVGSSDEMLSTYEILCKSMPVDS